MPNLPLILAALLAITLAAAAAGKLADRRGWATLAARVTPHPRRRRALLLGLPALEAATALALLGRPAVGLPAAAVLLAGLAAGAARLRGEHEGAACSCFGPLVPGALDRALVVRNLVLAGVAALAAPFAIAAGGRPDAVELALGAALAVAGALALRRRQAPRSGPRLGSRPSLDLPAGRPRVVVFLAPGCPPCEALAADVAALGQPLDGDVTAVLLDGRAEARTALAASLGTAARLDLADLGDAWQIPAAPYAVALDRDGRVRAAGVPESLDDLVELAGAAARGPEPRLDALSRRLVLRTAAGGAAAVGVAGVVGGRSGDAVAATRSVLAETSRALAAGPKVSVLKDKRNTVNGTCGAFGDRLLGDGTIDAGGTKQPKALGYTYADGLEPGQTPAGGTCRTTSKTTRIWRGHCSCPEYKAYTDPTKCAVDCPKGLKCAFTQCQTDSDRYCVDIKFDICLTVPKISISALKWVPPKNATKACKAYAKELYANTVAHEHHHADDVKAALDAINQQFKNRTVKGCGSTEAEARKEAELKMNSLVDRAKEQLQNRVDGDSNRFHQTPEGKGAIIDCRKCD